MQQKELCHCSFQKFWYICG